MTCASAACSAILVGWLARKSSLALSIAVPSLACVRLQQRSSDSKQAMNMQFHVRNCVGLDLPASLHKKLVPESLLARFHLGARSLPSAPKDVSLIAQTRDAYSALAE